MDNSTFGKPKPKPEPLKAILTQYGFTWGEHEINRVTEIEGSVILWVQTKRKKLEIRITPSGIIHTALTDQDGATYPRVAQRQPGEPLRPTQDHGVKVR